jgi:hypothetical protein
VLAAMPLHSAEAGPPFFTDDPVPLEHGHSEGYVFATLDEAPDGKEISVPAFEYNYGLGPDVMFHSVVPLIERRPDRGEHAYGLGDVELGVKYRFLQETDRRPQMAIFPFLELPTGDASAGTGNGRAWGIFPVWLEKSWGPWTTDLGAGRVFDSAPGQRDYSFGGALLLRSISDHLILGGEVFRQGAATEDGDGTTLVTFGGYFTPRLRCGGCQVLFDIGRSIRGERHTTAYLGLYWTWGPVLRSRP